MRFDMDNFVNWKFSWQSETAASRSKVEGRIIRAYGKLSKSCIVLSDFGFLGR
jgi:hypothetical protein